jgi:MtN3 and saliva related transmembrane protein
MYVLFTIGVGLWLVYGLIISSPPIWASNLVVLGLSITILFHKLKHG